MVGVAGDLSTFEFRYYIYVGGDLKVKWAANAGKVCCYFNDALGSTWQVFTDVAFCVSHFGSIWRDEAFSVLIHEVLSPQVLWNFGECFDEARHKGFLDNISDHFLRAGFELIEHN